MADREQVHRTMQQLARAKRYRNEAHERAAVTDRQLWKWTYRAWAAGMTMRRLATYLDVSTATAQRYVERGQVVNEGWEWPVREWGRLRTPYSRAIAATDAAAPPRPPGEGRQSSDGGREAAEGASE